LLGDSNSITLSEMFNIGGSNNLRGFNEYSIFTSQYALTSIEPRFFFNEQTYASFFCDYAVIKNTENTRYNQLFGFGFGSAFRTPAGIFSLAYAVGKEVNKLFSLRATKVHLRYIVMF
ncbi:MAG: BamA/TamA family outer membrane protein, partial [Bacteroidales bacterium]